jgi:O-antigen/teichoic acid export membrane protein
MTQISSDPPAGASRPVARLESWARAVGFNRAVLFGWLTLIFQFASTPVTVVMIARYLTPADQGFFYVFASLLALQTYVELGLSTVILNSASHLYAHLTFVRHQGLTGDPAAIGRLGSLGRFALQWYGAAALVFIVVVGGGGYVWLGRHGEGVDWAAPWCVLVVLTAGQFLALPFNALLEGCNQVTNIQRFRLSQVILRTLGLWLALGFHWGLWAAVVGSAVGLLRDVYLLGFEYRAFFLTLWRFRHAGSVRWREEIWPMQWRLAVSGILGYFQFQAFTPLMFQYYGPITAGQVGMTLSLVAGIQAIGLTFLQPRVPRFGMLIARREYGLLDREWWHLTRSTIALALAAALTLWAGVYVLHAGQFPLAARVLTPLPTALFLLGGVATASGYCLTAYLRAHVREPLALLSLVTSALMGALAWYLGRRFGPLGAAATYVAIAGGIALPWEILIWRRSRVEWHHL